MILIGLSGKKGSGKDTVADYLVRHYGFQKWAFAEPLKKICQNLFLLTDKQCHDPLQKEVVDPRWNRSPRQLFQLLGTDWVRRDIDRDFWVQRMRLQLQAAPLDTKVVICDVRFQNEKELIEECGGIVWGIHRNVQHTDSHASEKDMESFFSTLSIRIDNSGDLSSLFQKVDRVLDIFS